MLGKIEKFRQVRENTQTWYVSHKPKDEDVPCIKCMSFTSLCAKPLLFLFYFALAAILSLLKFWVSLLSNLNEHVLRTSFCSQQRRRCRTSARLWGQPSATCDQDHRLFSWMNKTSCENQLSIRMGSSKKIRNNFRSSIVGERVFFFSLTHHHDAEILPLGKLIILPL